MNLGKISLGLIVIFAGTILLLSNLSIISFNWSAVLYFWPALIILAGINILLPKKIEGQVVSIMATVVVLLLFTYQGLVKPNKAWRVGEKQSKTIYNEEVTLLSRDYNSDIEHAELTIKGGDVKYTLKKGESKLIAIEAKGAKSGFSLTSQETGKKTLLDFNQNNTKKTRSFDETNQALILLNNTPVWSIDLNIGAGVVDFDLSTFKVKDFEIKGGVSSIELKMGMPVGELSKINFKGGVSSLSIKLPKRAACIIHSKSGLSSLDFPGFKEQEDGSFQTENYAEATQRYELNLKNGLSSVEVIRY